MSILIGVLVLKALTGSIDRAHSAPTLARTESSCPFCGLDAVKDTDQQDNIVTLSIGSKKETYRCILCALAVAKDLKCDFSISTPSSRKGHLITVTRKQGTWSLDPDMAVFAYADGDHNECQYRFRALEDKSDFDDYVHSMPKILGHAKMLSLKDLLDKAK